MINRLFSRTALHEHAEPAQRVQGVTELAPESDTLGHLLAADPASEVRSAAAQRCTDLGRLAAAWDSETDPAVRATLAAALAGVISETPDGERASQFLDADACTDAIRSEVARRTREADRRRRAIAGIRDESVLVELALAAEHAETRMAAADRVRTPAGLRRLADAAKNKDHGVARLARQRIDAMQDREGQAAEADAILAELEALALRPGPILSAVVELNRRWQVLDMSGDAARLARCDAARQTLEARFNREQADQRARARFARRLGEWRGAVTAPATSDALAAMRTELADLRRDAQEWGDGTARSQLDELELRFDGWERDLRALADAEALVVEAEQLAAGTSIDNAKLPERWQALDRAIRTPALTQRFEAALVVIEQRRLEQIRVVQQESGAARQQVHGLLHAAEQALAAGQLQAARTAADEIRKLKASAGLLPKPTTQRLGRLVQQLGELERWESFGQHNARVQLCERAEALATPSLDAPQLALEVKKLRDEWKALDQQYAMVPKSLWERFDRACEKAYAPAARHFAEMAAQRKQARKQREDFIAAASAHAPTLLAEPHDWRAIERWLRETDHAWREGNLGSVEPGAWKKLDARLRSAMAPLRDALAAARDQAKAGRQALIAEASALAAKAMERDTPSQVKAIQARWQEQARAMSLAQRDERALWEEFRAACDAVFAARQTRRKEEDGRKQGNLQALEAVCMELEQLALAGDRSDQELRRTQRDAQERWKTALAGAGPVPARIESRFRSARTAIDTVLSTRGRSREAAVWQTLAAKERLCEELDALALSDSAATTAESAAMTVDERWAALPALPPAWEKQIVARRDAARAALFGPAAAGPHRTRIEHGATARSDGLLELEMLLGLDSPAHLQAQRLALQVKQLADRFKGAGSAQPPGERLLAWCAQPGVADAQDRQRCDRVIAHLAGGKVAAALPAI